MGMVNRAVVWPIARHDGDGFPLVLSPTDLRVRWEEKNIEMVDPNGERIQVDVILTSPQQIIIGSIMWEGTIATLPGSGVPTTNIYEVVARDRGDELKGRVTRYEFGLKRYKDKIPRVVTS